MNDLDILKKLIDDYAHRMHSLFKAVAEHKDHEALFKRAMEIYLKGDTDDSNTYSRKEQR